MTRWPLCVFCRREVRPGGHKVESCMRWVLVERDWLLWKGRR